MGRNGPKTTKNLLRAFVGESQARNRYICFAAKARWEDFVQIADIFEKTANQEREHARCLSLFLTDGNRNAADVFPSDVIGTTCENLLASAAVEQYEHAEMYPGFAETAREEGFGKIAQAFLAISVAEKQHGKRFLALAENVARNRVFHREQAVTWHCRNCGFLREDRKAPAKCPACTRSKGHFELLGENW